MKLDLDYTVYKGHQSRKILKSTGHKHALARDEVLLRITHAGLCGTDEHYKSTDMVLGHEGVGVVEKVGTEVDTFKVYVFLGQEVYPYTHFEPVGIAPVGDTSTIVACTVISA